MTAIAFVINTIPIAIAHKTNSIFHALQIIYQNMLLKSVLMQLLQ